MKILLALLLSLSLVSITPSPGAFAQTSEQVYYNQANGKYHGLGCKWGKRCTVNCVKIPRSEAVRKGGVPCKVCYGR